MSNSRYHYIKDSVCNENGYDSTERGWNQILTRTNLTPEEKEVIEECLPLPLVTPWSSLMYPTIRSLIKNYRIIHSAYVTETDALAHELQNKTIKISQSKIKQTLDSALKYVAEDCIGVDDKTNKFIHELLYSCLANYGISEGEESDDKKISASALLQARKEFDSKIESYSYDSYNSISDRTKQQTILIVRPEITKAINDVIAANTTNKEILQSLNKQSKLCIAMVNVWRNFLRRHYREADRLLEKHLNL